MLESTPLILFRWEIEADTSDIVAQVAGIYSGEERISYPRRAGEPTDCKQHMGSCGGCSKRCMTGLQSFDRFINCIHFSATPGFHSL